MRAARVLGLPLVAALIACPAGCRSTGEAASDFYDATAAIMTPNPVAVGPYLVGLGLGFVASAPLILLSWPLTELCYPLEEEDVFYYHAALAPSWACGTLVGTALAGPFYPLGWPWVPAGPEAAKR